VIFILQEKLFVYDCKWNYRPDHCMYGSNCKTAEKDGVRILHGCRRVFQNDKEPAFSAIYNEFKEVIMY
jgi:UDP-xylose:glucoside alpha-1,3-xylosyltransferase